MLLGFITPYFIKFHLLFYAATINVNYSKVNLNTYISKFTDTV